MKHLILSLILTYSMANAHDHDPETPHTGVDKELNLRLFKKWKKVNWMADIQYTDRDHEDDVKSFTFGGKYRLFRNLKMGAAISRQYGNRHDDDWVVDSGRWFWKDTESRGETLAIIDLLPRMLLPFLPGERWVGEFRFRMIHNFFNSQNTLKLRPRLTYFWFKNNKPFMNIFTQYEVYLPLNYGDKTFYEKWFYLGGLYHFNKWFKPGLSYAYKSMTWTTGSDGREIRPNQPYDVTHKGHVFALNLIFNLP